MDWTRFSSYCAAPLFSFTTRNISLQTSPEYRRLSLNKRTGTGVEISARCRCETLVVVLTITTNHWQIFLGTDSTRSRLGAECRRCRQLADVNVVFVENTHLPALGIARPVRKRVACALERCLVADSRQTVIFGRIAFCVVRQETTSRSICKELSFFQI